MSLARALGVFAFASFLHWALSSSLSAQHLGDLLVASVARGSGALTVLYDFEQPVRLSRTFAQGGLALFTSINPGFDAVLSDDPSRSVYRLKDGTAVRLELLGLSPGTSVKIGSRILDAPGTSAALGTMPDLHVHPEWRLFIPEEASGEFWIEFRLSTTARGYSPSPMYRLRLALPTSPEATPTAGVSTRSPTQSPTATEATPTSTPTQVSSSEPSWTPTVTATPTRQEPTRAPTASPSPVAGLTPSPTETIRFRSDFNCDGRVTAADIVAAVALAGGAVRYWLPAEVCGDEPAPGQPVGRTIVDLFTEHE